MKKIILIFAVVFAINLVFTSCKSDKKEVKKEEVTSSKKETLAENVYQCPMKCEKEKTYDKKGKCPVCEMDLRKKLPEKK